MKKFLSLLLALTLVLSLVVVPARADVVTPAAATGTTISASTLTLEKGANAGNTLTVTTTNAKVGDVACTASTYTWDSSNKAVATVTGSNETATINALMAGTTTITCKVAYTYTDPTDSSSKNAEQTVSCTVTVTDAFKAAITGITYNGRPCVISGNNLTYYTISSETGAAQWSVTAASEYGTPTASLSGNVLTVTGANSVTTTYNATPEAATVTLGTPTPSTISKDGTTSITATVKGFTPVQYTWAYTKDSDATVHAIPNQAASTLTWTPGTAGTYKVTCTATYKQPSSAEANDGVSVTSSETTITVENKTYAFAGNSAIYVNKNETKYVDAKLYPAGSSTAVNDARYTYTVSPSTPNVVTVASDGRITVQNSGYANVTVSSNYKGRAYSFNVVIYASALSADLSRQVYFNNPVSYTYSDLIEAANKALSGSYGYGSYYGTVTTIVSASAPVSLSSLGTFAGSISNNVGAIYATASYNGRGKAPITATVKTSTGQNVTVTLNIPVVPTPVTFDSIAAEPVTNNYNSAVTSYRINFPSTYSTYYVIQKNGTTAPDYAAASLGTAYSASTPYTLTSTDFGTNGQCTLYVIATNNYTYGSSYGTYYSGAITVTQTNYDIKYNGVAGETVQFAQSDFNDFMNEVAEARGDASKTKSYPYVTFDYVTFSLPTTAQGTLYYGGTAMSTSNSSGAFNTRTKVTNLDSVTFVPNAKTTAKTITLNFTLYATRYSSSSTSRGTTVSYSGSVVVNLVREDIKYTVSQGDSVRFDESDFLSYLCSTKGYSSNYTIDYVTFDQSAVDTINGGVLYSGYAGYNQVKTTDKFYYTTTNNYTQNALSDVTFRASRYAKTGETVYIPFTIYARYGTTGTGTRQLTGTVAVKIGQTMNFIDVKTTDYFYNSVKWAVGKNITNGTSSTTFSPYKSCTRAEIVTFLWRAAGSPEPTTTRNPFRDVNAVTHSSYYKAILWASQKGITSGTNATTFSPYQECTRSQIVTFLYRYAGKPSGYYSNPFKDVGATSEASYYNAILWAVGKGITTGTSATTFSPYASCNRAEAVTFLYRYTNGL